MHEAAGMHLISTCTGNEVGSSYVLAFGSWITFVSCNALGVTLHIGIRDRTMDNGKQLIILVMMIIDSYQRLKDPYTDTTLDQQKWMLTILKEYLKLYLLDDVAYSQTLIRQEKDWCPMLM